MNRYALQCLKNYPLSKYFIRYEKEYYNKYNQHGLDEMEITLKKWYKSPNKVLGEKIVDIQYPFRNSQGYILGYFYMGI
jgi:hypothetical protein